MSGDPPLLEARGLEKYFSQNTNFIDTLLRRDADDVQAVDDVSFVLNENGSQGVIGESGCGKTTLLRTLMGLYEPTGGEIRYKGQAFSEFDKADWKEYRSNVQIIFQDPFNSLDPKMTVGEAIREPLEVHDMDNKRDRIERSLEDAELRPAEQYIDQFPGQLSGGERQRVSIARALATDPDLIFADEPASMLDVSTQAAVLELLSDLIDDYGVAMMYISHDLSTVAYICQKINTMYLGRFVESAPTEEFLENPKHPYAQALLGAVPIPDPHHGRGRTELEGDVVEPVGLGEGCRFRDRCPERMDICETMPRSVNIRGRDTASNESESWEIDVDPDKSEEWAVACHLYYDHESHAEGADTTSSAEPASTDD